LGDVVDVDVFAKNGGGVDVCLFDGGTCKADEASLGQGIADVFSKAVFGTFTDDSSRLVEDVDLGSFESILAAVGFICQDDNIRSIANLGIEGFTVSGGEFLHGSKYDPARNDG
jgi:hypothetical protein